MVTQLVLLGLQASDKNKQMFEIRRALFIEVRVAVCPTAGRPERQVMGAAEKTPGGRTNFLSPGQYL